MSAAKFNRKLKYKELIEKGARVGEVIENQDVLDSFKNIMEIIEICDKVSTDYAKDAKIECTSDYLLDASIIKMSHDLMESMSEKMGNNDFREDEYIASLLSMMMPERNSEFLNIVISCSHGVEFSLPMTRTFEWQEPRIKKENLRKERQRKKSKLAQKKCPENVKLIKKEDKGAEKINIMRSEIQRVIKERKTDCLPYFEAIIDPKNYMSSIDAAFQISFLVRDGILGIKRVNDEPFIFFSNSEGHSSNHHSQQAENTVQTVMSLSPQIWKEEAKKYKLKAPILKLNSHDDSSGDCDSDD